MRRLEGKVAIVTGGGSGIGRATVLRLAEEGAAVGVADIREDAARAVADEVTASNGRALPLNVDVSEEEAVARMINATVSEFGGLDVMHNNAALMSPEIISRDGKVADFDREVFDKAVAVNLLGAIFGCKYAIPRLIERGGGAIINTSSVGALKGNTYVTVYAMTKAALITLTNYVSAQYIDAGIRCNAIAPGWIHTPAVTANRTEEMIASSKASGIMGDPADIAAAVAFLASDDGRFVSGQTLVVDGGQLRAG